ncbi:MAG: sugar transferase [Candidatus Omnitrophica bacterium]|nr:sugar transferase [Candidatus Omnitrophota bacterium]
MSHKSLKGKIRIALVVGVFIFALIGLASFLYVGSSSASDLANNHAVLPEPSSAILLGGGGVVGAIVRFARRRFQEFKRIFDCTVSFLGLLSALPLLILVGLFIKIVSPGPIFFKQARVGKEGVLFTIYKLRTMRVDAEKETGAVWAKENDPRLIAGGKWIRKMHLDEIPQLWNVLRGEMSFIGPRPERPEFVNQLREAIPDYERRLKVKPGITGLAQVWHKYDETVQDVRKKVKYDLLYIRKMCLLVDLRILVNTFVVVLTGKGAR